MTLHNIYDAAISLFGQEIGELNGEDYLARTPYLLSLIFMELAPYDVIYRDVYGLPKQDSIPLDAEEQSNDSPICSAFFTVCAYYLASLLIFDTDIERSDQLYERYCELLTSLMSGLPAKSAGIVNVYPNC